MSLSEKIQGTTWHTQSAQDVCQRLQTSLSGLSNAEASARLTEFGLNELQAAHKISGWSIFLSQFKNVLIIILLIAIVLSAALGEVIDALAIGIILLFAVILGFIQEFRAERAIEALRKMAAPTASVLREGVQIEIPARELVPGDVVLLQAGDKIPADARLIDAINLQIEESSLTGESVAVEKNSDALLKPELSLGDLKNMVFAGTAATYGRGRAVVVATGMATEFGKIAQMLTSVESSKTPLQENLDKVGNTLARAALVMVALIVALGLFRGQPVLEMLVFGIALAVAVVPEALPAVVTISLAIGVQRMVKRHALVRKLPAVETLGSTSIICSDKTGTLTTDSMTARKLLVGTDVYSISGAGYNPVGEFTCNGIPVKPDDLLKLMLKAAALCSDTTLSEADGRWTIKGDPTEGALVVAAAKAGLNKADLDAEFPRIDEIPFTSETKRMTTLHRLGDDQDAVAYSKGAPEVILSSCSFYQTKEGVLPLSIEAREQILNTAKEMASEALRVLAVSMKHDTTRESAEQDMVFLGLIGMIDPPRPEAKAAIEKCDHAGIRVVMITGDHPITARAVAKELGILKGGRIITGLELEALSDEELEHQVEHINVYARVSPSHKLRVVTALQKKNHIVAMTGDGVNDAPALKRADIGIAMGITGTDVTKEASAMTLTDDNFASIVAAVEEGRGIFGNIKKYLMYLLSSNIGEIGLMAGATLVGLPLPLSAVQILYVNLATDGLPALALSVDPPDADLMRLNPRNPRKGIFTRPLISLMVIGGLWSAIVNIVLFAWALNTGMSLSEAMTMSFVSLVLIQFFKAYNFRSDRHSALHRPFANKWLNLSIIWELLLLCAVIYIPFLQKAIGTYSLPLADWIIILCVSLSVSPVLELTKWMIRKGWFGEVD
ncbi:MAG: cation-translocating P-type ATPase [Chlorobiales bacterium]|nr:cation-translocating P-type ATPase [Chlorobiales bacterium]